MARTARIKSKTGIYHIVLRGNNKQQIFLEEEDYKRLLDIVSDYSKSCDYSILAYCLMGNHIHLLLKTGETELAKIMKRIVVKFVYYYNTKYDRVWHLFQDRFKSEPVENDEYLLEVVRYIHQNPIKANICYDVGEYEYSSYKQYEYVLKRSLRDYPQIDEDGLFSKCIEELKNMIGDIYSSDDIEYIRGLEGLSAKKYFNVFDKMVLKNKDDFKLVKRSKRPPLDCINSVLSFLYTIYTYDYASAAEACGLDSYVGFYHTLRSGRNSLACDLVEETRCIVERLVLTMINLQIITKKDFEKQTSGAVLLNDEGRKKVLAKWQEKKRSQITHPYLKQKIEIGLIPYTQCSLLSKYIRGEIDEYPCFLMK